MQDSTGDHEEEWRLSPAELVCPDSTSFYHYSFLTRAGLLSDHSRSISSSTEAKELRSLELWLHHQFSEIIKILD